MVALTQYVRGQPLLARQLNETVDAVNRLTDAQPTPEQTNRPVGDPELTEEENAEVTPEVAVTTTWTETLRTTDQVDVDGVLIDRIKVVEFQDFSGNTMTLIFNNP